MDLRWRIPLERGIERKLRAPEKYSGLAKGKGNKVVLLWRQTRINIKRSYGSVKTDVCPWDKNLVIYAFSSGHWLFS